MNKKSHLIDVHTACVFAGTFLADPILVMGAKAVLRNAPAAEAISIADIRLFLTKKLSQWNASEDWKTQPADLWGRKFIADCLDTLKSLEEACSFSESNIEMVVTQTMEDPMGVGTASSEGWCKKHFFCPVCNLEAGYEILTGDRVFDSGSVLKTNLLPSHCPNCGTGLRRPAERKEGE